MQTGIHVLRVKKLGDDRRCFSPLLILVSQYQLGMRVGEEGTGKALANASCPLTTHRRNAFAHVWQLMYLVSTNVVGIGPGSY